MKAALCTLATLGFFTSAASAHPVPKDAHDRTIVVRLQKGLAANQVRVRVEYRLEVDETTVLLNDMKPFSDEVNPLDYRNRPLDYYAQFAKIYGPIYADRLSARVNKKPIGDFRCVSHRPALQDAEGKNLGHLRCDFVFEASFELQPGAIDLHFHEGNYLLEAGQITLSFANETGLATETQMVPDDTLRKRIAEGAEPGDEDRLRTITAMLLHAETKAPRPAENAPATESLPKAHPPRPKDFHDERFSLFRLIFESEYGFMVILLLAFVFGAAHALTPGHGKTLVAAYLVGERGTVWHALFLGLVTTLTHTGSILILGVVAWLLPSNLRMVFVAWITQGLGLVMGLIVTGIGFWLLLQRLAGRADHVHIGGGHHHHHDHHGATPTTTVRTLSWGGLVMLGVTGGMVPCVDAIVLFLYSVGTSHFWLALPATIAFSAGLAVVLVVIGILVVQVPRFVEARAGDGRLLRALPIISAILVTLMGLWLCYEGAKGM